MVKIYDENDPIKIIQFMFTMKMLIPDPPQCDFCKVLMKLSPRKTGSYYGWRCTDKNCRTY